MARYVLAGILCVAMVSCREIIPFQDESGIEGYQLIGTVTTPDGIPIDNVQVLLTYNYEFVSDTPVDTQHVAVVKASSLVDVAAYNPQYEFVRQIFYDYRTTGPVPRYYWNGRDQSGNLVPSGRYLIRYAVDATIVKYVQWIVEGHVTTHTDANGKFTLSDHQLPIGNVFDIYDNTDAYLGTYRIAPSINIRITKLTQTSTFIEVGVTKNSLTKRTFVLQ